MNWFEQLVGFREESREQVHQNIVIEGERMTSLINGNQLTHGTLELVSLAELRSRVATLNIFPQPVQLEEVVGDVQAIHADETNQDAVFQVASQFNLLEMISPEVTPERGISGYEDDRTQGPACAMAAGAGTLYRQYFVPVLNQKGQTAQVQLDGLANIGTSLGNNQSQLWAMKNGYALPSQLGLEQINAKLSALNSHELDELRSQLKIGVQWNTQVTLPHCNHLVTQVYCSALPVSYSQLSPQLWKTFAVLILEAAYEATFCTAMINAHRTGNRRLYLTLLGGGAFGNDNDWILNAIAHSISLYSQSGLDIAIVSYGQSKPFVQKFIDAL